MTVGMKKFLVPFIAAGFLCAAAVQAAIPEPPEKVIEVTVSEHETLWDIAAAHTDNETDVRKMIYTIREINHISDPASIQPGQVLKVPG